MPSSPASLLPQGIGMASIGRNGGTPGLSPLSAAPIRAASQSEGPPMRQPNQADGRKLHDDAPISRPALPSPSVSRLTDYRGA